MSGLKVIRYLSLPLNPGIIRLRLNYPAACWSEPEIPTSGAAGSFIPVINMTHP